MDFLKKAVASATSNEEKPAEKPSPRSEPEPEPEAKPQDHHAHSTSTTELLSSAKVVAGAAQSTVKHEAVDKPKVAAAADDLVHGAAEYGKLEEKGYGQYVEKADTYIHKYSSGAAEDSAGNKESSEGEKKHSSGTAEDSTGNKESSEGEKSEGGVGGYVKMAKGFMK